MRRYVLLFMAVLSLISLAAADEKLVEQLRQLDTSIARADEEKQFSAALPDDLRHRLRAVNQDSTQQWRTIDSRDKWEAYRLEQIAALRESLHWPSERGSLESRSTGTLEGDGFAIDNLLFQSRPGVWVTANLYRPAKPQGKMPGILLCHSHHNPKTQSELQTMGMTWARAGCLVLVMDQLGHGERRQHPFRTAEDYLAESFRASRQDYWFRYDVSLQLYLAGESLMGYMAWDLSRGVDVLLAQEGIDASRIILMGAVAGGGDPAAVAGALDERITVVVPFNFGGPQPESRYPLPEDAEETFGYAGSGSWESTRNLAHSASGGFLPWVIVGSVAPRKLIYGHEFSWDRQRDPVWKRLSTIFTWYDAADNLAFAHGTGLLQGQAPEASHCNNIGAVHRRHIHAALKNWYGIDVDPNAEYSKTRPSDELHCVTGDVNPLPPVRETLAAQARQSTSDFLKRLATLDAPARRDEVARRWTKLLGNVQPQDAKAEVRSAETVDGATIERVLLSGTVPVPLVLIRPKSDAPVPVVVGVAGQGKAKFLAERAAEISALLQRNIAVALVDVRGTGETAVEDRGRDRTSHATSLSASEMMLGGTIMGAQLRDLRSVLSYLKGHKEIDSKGMAVWGESFAPVTDPKRGLVVPHGVDRPGNCEPAGGMLALLAALYEPQVRAVAVHRGLASYASAFERPCVYLPHDAVVPGAATSGDVAGLVAALDATRVRLWEMTNAMNRELSDEEARKELSPRKALEIESLDGGALANWFAGHLGAKR